MRDYITSLHSHVSTKSSGSCTDAVICVGRTQVARRGQTAHHAEHAGIGAGKVTQTRRQGHGRARAQSHRLADSQTETRTGWHTDT